MTIIAFQGQPGAYSDLACRNAYPGAQTLPCETFEAAMEAEPFSGVAMPLDVEAVGADPVEASEGRVELLAEIFREAGAVALDEAILGAMPFAEDIDGIVELRRPD